MQSRPTSYAILCQIPSHFMKHVAQSCGLVQSCMQHCVKFPSHFVKCCTKLWSCPKLYAILCNMLPKVGSDFVQYIAQNRMLPRLAQIPTSVKQWSTHPSSTKCHLQPYKCSMQKTYNCGTPVICIMHVQSSQL